ncbi:DNA translocase FtsK [Methylopila sp. M107]|uniref:DNA translocase FtsK n=1 Tax=Methylopila sp. M107 TaxID=1101190 RepID=UPI000376E413|nr:DNA translocase FtsK [Methylopila sp. M107]
MRFNGQPPFPQDERPADGEPNLLRKPAPLVRSVRTPDSVLQARRARSVAAANEAALEASVDERAAPAPTAAAPAPEAEDGAETPSWLKPFASAPNIRFTRTPDSILRGRTRGGSGEETQPIEPQAAADAIAGMAFPGAGPSRRPVPTSIQRLADAIRIGHEAPPQPDQDNVPTVEEILAESPSPAGGETVGSMLTGSLGQPFVSFAPVTYRASFGWDQPVAAPAPAPVRRRPVASVEAREAAQALQQATPAPAAEPAPVPAPMPAVAAPVVVASVAPPAVEYQPLQRAPQPVQPAPVAKSRPEPAVRPHAAAAARPTLPSGVYEPPSLDLLAQAPDNEPAEELSEEALEKNSVKLQQTLQDFGVRGEIIDANPGPVVTLYELEPAPGVKSSRVIALASDIARSMSAKSARVAVVEGRNVIGIELPNAVRETVYLRELLEDPAFAQNQLKLPVCLGKTIGGEPVIADLAKMPHLLVAGTTGSGKSVAINTMILSLLYMHSPEKCRLIMVDPKMLELSVYEGIPHLLTPVVTDPKKAVIALKWAVREMEDRYRKMSKLGVRNIDGFNARAAEARLKGEEVVRQVQTGFDRETGQPIFEDEVMDLTALPYIVVIVDEMADLMMVAGKDIEGAIQRLAQMARAAGIHIVMATQRPSVDVITGTIKANFPTRISFQVTSKIDSRTILGEMGAEQLLGQGDMLHMQGGGRIARVHGPFVSDAEVEKVVDHLKLQGRPDYVDAVTADEEELAGAIESDEDDGAVFDAGEFGGGEDSGDMYEQAVAVVLRDKKASTSYIQRRLQVGYNRAASLMERMEKDGIVGPANHAGKREIFRER